MALLPVGAKAPDFKLTASDGRVVSLSDFREKQNVVIVFYPRNNTPG